MPERSCAIGLTLFWPAYFGAEPCVGSKTATPLAEVRAGRDAEAADQSGGEVGDDVAVQVRQHHHVVLLGPLDELHAHVVRDPVVELDVGVLGGDLARDAQPETVGELHDVRLVHRRDLLAAHPARVVERELEHPARAGDRDRLDRDAGVGLRQLVAVGLEPGDQLLGLGSALLELDSRRRCPRSSRARSRGRRPRTACGRPHRSCTGAPARTGRARRGARR